MKIQRISCTQFAGIRDKDIALSDGLNVIYGKNESGKSTLVNLLSRTLFQNARIDGRKDKEFRELYFPGMRKDGSVAGDFADGKISFTTEKGVYTLAKEWGQEARCTLSTPEGVIRDPQKIDAALQEVLLYGAGVYGEMLFSSQRNTALALETLLDRTKKTEAKQEIADAVTRAFAESDGISLDVIEEAIQRKIEEIAGKHWDIEQGAPLRKAGAGRWTKELGKILTAYYQREDAQSVLAEIRHLEGAVDLAVAEYVRQNEEASAAEKAYEDFQRFAGLLQAQQERKKAIARINGELAKYKEAAERWPRMVTGLEQSKRLKRQRDNRALWDQYVAVKAIAEEKQQLEKDLGAKPCPTAEEVQAVKSAQRKLAYGENQLCGMNMQAAVQMFAGQQMVITSLCTGEKLELTEGSATIREAVRLEIPDVMVMELAPVNVDIKSVEMQIAEAKATINDVLTKYQAATVEELEDSVKNAASVSAKLDVTITRLNGALGTISFAELETAAKNIGEPIMEKAAIEQEIYRLLGDKDLDNTIVATETRLGEYGNQYDSQEALQEKIREAQEELAKVQEDVTAGEMIPAAFREVVNAQQHLTLLKEDLTAKRQRREAALTARTEAISRLEHYQENISGDAVANLENAERNFQEQQNLLGCWLHIAEVFARQKETLANNPMEDIADSFAGYLEVISGGQIASEFPDGDKLAMEIYSDNRVLDYGKLSEGTKETVSLAFRLAVLDHLFPQGGVIVFDDPFANMDKERQAAAWHLVEACAQRHQVIFFTCKEEYPQNLAAKIIQM